MGKLFVELPLFSLFFEMITLKSGCNWENQVLFDGYGLKKALCQMNFLLPIGNLFFGSYPQISTLEAPKVSNSRMCFFYLGIRQKKSIFV